MNYEGWLETVPSAITHDSLWKLQVYRLALFAADVGWLDSAKLQQDRRMWSTSDQLYAALGSVSANIAEGYSRGSGKDRVRFYEYALGSARESRDWYFKARHILGEKVAEHRINLQTEVIRLLLSIIPQEREIHLREIGPRYETLPSLESDLEPVLAIIPL